MTTESRLTVADIATQHNIRPSTWRAYVARGQAPPPDGRLGTTPYWLPATINAWRSPHDTH